MTLDLRRGLGLSDKGYGLLRCHRSAVLGRVVDVVGPYIAQMLLILKVVDDDLIGGHGHLFECDDLIAVALFRLDIRIREDQEQYEPHYQEI